MTDIVYARQWGHNYMPPRGVILTTLNYSQHLFHYHKPMLLAETSEATSKGRKLGTASVWAPNIMWRGYCGIQHLDAQCGRGEKAGGKPEADVLVMVVYQLEAPRWSFPLPATAGPRQGRLALKLKSVRPDRVSSVSEYLTGSSSPLKIEFLPYWNANVTGFTESWHASQVK